MSAPSAQTKPITRLSTLPRSFYEPSAEIVAAKLLGQLLVRRTDRGPCGGLIVETEAYVVGDAACHAFNGPTKRNAAMWGPAGYSYIYFIYGNHWCFNVVCQPPGIAEAVLVRAIEPTLGLDEMRERRPVRDHRQLSNGPGKLCAALDINRSQDNVDLCDTNSPVFIAENKSRKSFLKQRGPRVIGTRIGIRLAAEMPLRFYLERSEFVSRR